MVYDASRDSFVMYGGSKEENRLGDTWEFRDGDWAEIPADGGDPPPALTAHTMVYDLSRGREVLFGGQLGIFDASGELQTEFNGDIYEFDGVVWERIPVPDPRPEPRAAHAAVYDSRRGRMWVFGGRKKINTLEMELLNDTWYYDGSVPAWVRVESADAPTPRESCSMVYDASADRIYLSGGGFFRDRRSNETWVFDPGLNQWSQLPVSATPAARQNAAMAYTGDGKSVLFGGSRTDYAADRETWILEGEDWKRATTAGLPRARSGAILAAGPGPEEALLFGGSDPSRTFNDTWRLSYQPTPTVTPTSTATPAATPTPSTTPGLLFDLNGDMVVDGVDLFLMAADWQRGAVSAEKGASPAADMDGSGAVDAADLLLLIEAWSSRGD
jgi:hypothetical protein